MSTDTNALAAYISRRLDEVSTEEDIPISMAWARISAEMLGYNPDTVEFFPNRDCGIDYYTRSDRTFEVFQCKMHEPDDAGNLELKAAFGPEGYEDINRAALFLLRQISPTNVDPRLLGFREQLKEEISLVSSTEDEGTPKAAVSLVFRLVTLGDNLSPAAKDRTKALRSEFKQLEQEYPGIKLSLEHTGITDLQ